MGIKCVCIDDFRIIRNICLCTILTYVLKVLTAKYHFSPFLQMLSSFYFNCSFGLVSLLFLSYIVIHNILPFINVILVVLSHFTSCINWFVFFFEFVCLSFSLHFSSLLFSFCCNFHILFSTCVSLLLNGTYK